MNRPLTVLADTPRVFNCDVYNLTVDQGSALQAFLLQALAQEHPVSLAQTQEIDLAGIQLLLAFQRERDQQGRPSFALPLPQPVLHALALAGCGDCFSTT